MSIIIIDNMELRTSAAAADDVDTSIYPSIDRIPQTLYPSLLILHPATYLSAQRSELGSPSSSASSSSSDPQRHHLHRQPYDDDDDDPHPSL